MVEPEVSISLTFPICLNAKTSSEIPFGKTYTSVPAFVYYIPSAIYHGLRGATIGANGRIYTELLDSSPAHLDLSPIKTRPISFKGRVMALSNSKNYYHWLIKMLPRLHLVAQAEGSLDHIDAFLVNKPTWQQLEIYKRLNIWSRCVIIDRKSFAVCRLFVSPSLAHAAPEWACRSVRDKIGPATTLTGGEDKRIYVTRGKTVHRSLLNELEVCGLLTNYGFQIVDCTLLSVEEQAALFAQSSLVVGIHGAALSNLVFCHPGTFVLEIFGAPENPKFYRLISHHMRLHYHYMLAESVASEAMAGPTNLKVDLELLARGIETLLDKMNRPATS